MDTEQLKRIADAIEEILQLVKADQERSRKYILYYPIPAVKRCLLLGACRLPLYFFNHINPTRSSGRETRTRWAKAAPPEVT